jgi:hypothetical protein
MDQSAQRPLIANSIASRTALRGMLAALGIIKGHRASSKSSGRQLWFRKALVGP